MRTVTRLAWPDQARGLAVILMVSWHTASAWVSADLQSGKIFWTARLLGGLAAPLFFVLLGVSYSVARSAEKPTNALVHRGLEIVLLGYLLRCQVYLVDYGALLGETSASSCVLTLVHAIALLCVWRGMRSRSWKLTALGLTASLVAFALMDPTAQRVLFKVDVLQTLGVSLVILSLLRVERFRSHTLFACAGALMLVAGWQPLVRLLAETNAPLVIAGYLSERDGGGAHLSHFPLLGWLPYALAGVLVNRFSTIGSRSRWLLVAASAIVATATLESLPLGYELAHLMFQEAQLAVQPTTRFVFRLAALLLVTQLFWAIARVFPGGLVVSMGRHSVFCYWVHLPFAFGALSRPLARNLNWPQWTLAFFIMVALIGFACALLPKKLRRRIRNDRLSVGADYGSSSTSPGAEER